MLKVMGEHNAALILIYFTGAIVLTLAASVPHVVLPSFVLSFAYMLSLSDAKTRSMSKRLLFMLPFLTIFNALFNRHGLTTLFTVFGIDISLEALLYGLHAGFMLLAVLFWFFLMQYVLTNARLIRILGRRLPTLSLMVSMVFRYVPDSLKAEQHMEEARVGMLGGLVIDEKRVTRIVRRMNGLFLYSLESSIMTVRFMRARGFDKGERSHFANNVWRRRDRRFLFFLLPLVGLLIYLFTLGASAFLFYPFVHLPERASISSRWIWLFVLSFIYFLIPLLRACVEWFFYREMATESFQDRLIVKNFVKGRDVSR